MSEQGVTDEVLTAAQQGDSAAFRTIYDTLAPQVLGYLTAKGVADAEGVTSEVFLGLLPRLTGISGGASGLRKMLFSIAHARMVDDHRGRARRPAAVSYQPELDARTVVSAEEQAAESLATAHVIGILAVLPEDQRDVLTLRVVADLSIDQVAEVLGRSSGSVKQLQRRALLAVRLALQERRVTL